MHKKFMRRVIFLLAAVLMISYGSVVYAGTIESSGTCGENATWTLDSEGVLTISGTGDMWSCPHFSQDKVKKVIIEDGVTSISNLAFSGCSELTSITIPESVISIGENAFYYCTGLTSVTLPNSVTSIGEEAFSDCERLAAITIPDSVTSIGDNAFYRCKGLTSITIPGSVTKIGNYAFLGCEGLTSITISTGVNSIGSKAFYDCKGLTSIIIPGSVTRIGDDAFTGCSGLKSVIIQDGVTEIGGSAFSSCIRLESITIPDSVTSISNYVFSGCSGLKSITIPNSVTYVGDSAFFLCTIQTICGDVHSYIYTYAKSKNIKFQCLEHQSIVTLSEVAATCTSTGLTEGKKCEDCETTIVEQKIIPANEHTYGNGYVCNFCGYEDEALKAKRTKAKTPILRSQVNVNAYICYNEIPVGFKLIKDDKIEYQIYRSTSPNKNFKKVKTIKIKYYQEYTGYYYGGEYLYEFYDKKLKPNKKYYYKIRARYYNNENSNKWSAFSKAKAYWTTPKPISKIKYNDNTRKLTIPKVKNVSGYVYHCTGMKKLGYNIFGNIVYWKEEATRVTKKRVFTVKKFSRDLPVDWIDWISPYAKHGKYYYIDGEKPLKNINSLKSHDWGRFA